MLWLSILALLVEMSPLLNWRLWQVSYLLPVTSQWTVSSVCALLHKLGCVGKEPMLTLMLTHKDSGRSSQSNPELCDSCGAQGHFLATWVHRTLRPNIWSVALGNQVPGTLGRWLFKYRREFVTALGLWVERPELGRSRCWDVWVAPASLSHDPLLRLSSQLLKSPTDLFVCLWQHHTVFKLL